MPIENIEVDNDAYFTDFKKRKPKCLNNNVSLLSNLLSHENGSHGRNDNSNHLTECHPTIETSELSQSLKQHIELEQLQSMTPVTTTPTNTTFTSAVENDNNSYWNDNFSRW